MSSTSRRITPFFPLVLILAIKLDHFPAGAQTSAGEYKYPSPDVVESTLITTVSRDFSGHRSTFIAAHHWERARLLTSGEPAPYLACGEYGRGHVARKHLEDFLEPSAVQVVSHNEEGVCLVATMLPGEAETLIDDPSAFGLTSAGPFLSVLKLAPGLLDHGPLESVDSEGQRRKSSGLVTTYGNQVSHPGVKGLSIRLSPGVLKARDPSARALAKDWHAKLVSTRSTTEMQSSNFWSDPGMLRAGDGHLSRPMGEFLAREWTRAAEVVGEAMRAGNASVGEVCGWGQLRLHPSDDDLLHLAGIDHLLSSEENSETQTACFMCLLSQLASTPEVLWVSASHKMRLLNGVARAIVQSADIFETPLLDQGLDGTGEVIQIIDTGLDETSCFFKDEDGMEIEHGYYFVGEVPAPGDSYHYDLTRRKVVQYIELESAQANGLGQADGDAYSHNNSESDSSHKMHPESSDQDEDGHGTHTAGTAAGSRLASSYPPTCPEGHGYGCVGRCITQQDVNTYLGNTDFDLDTYCPTLLCDGNGEASPNCLSDDIMQNLDANSGVAPGAKVAIFDAIPQTTSRDANDAGNGLWEVALDTGAKIHSNSWGFDVGTDQFCVLKDLDVTYDTFMYENPEHLLLFSSGNDGEYRDYGFDCTVSSPALAKNTLTIGATSSGPTRAPESGTDGRRRDVETGPTASEAADIDTVAVFSSYGWTTDLRIKPELVAPGDRVFSAASDKSDDHNCMLTAEQGTSMACPVVAGAAALVRQYFTDGTFYADDVAKRGFCGTSLSIFRCVSFAPSAATVKAMLINSANLMGGSTIPTSDGGFGRIHLGAGMPTGGEGNLALFVADSLTTTITADTATVYTFNVDGSAGQEFRATLSWIDPPAFASTVIQMVHNLDLSVTAPDGTTYYMFGSAPAGRNVNERVIVPAAAVTTGVWMVRVSVGALTMDEQSYSLVVTGALVP